MLSRTLIRRHLLHSQRVVAIVRTYTSRHDPAGDSRVGIAQSLRPDSAGYGDLQKSKPLNPNSPGPSATNGPRQRIPRVGTANTPPELTSTTESVFSPENSEDIQRIVGGYLVGQDSGPGLGGSFGGEKELGVGEMAEGKFRIEPLRRQGEDLSTMRARLLYQSRKRGILETDLLLSTFADSHLSSMSLPQLHQYDLFLDENDWDIYYWTTQSPPQEASGDTTSTQGKQADVVDSQKSGQAAPQSESQMQGTNSGTNQPLGFGEGPVGEWAQTVGRVKEPYRPPPSRWRDSEILEMLRAHVKKRKGGEGAAKNERKGLGRMPDVKQF